jgi:hypothetical protein
LVPAAVRRAILDLRPTACARPGPCPTSALACPAGGAGPAALARAAPLAIVDYDGTIAQTDVSDTLMAQFVNADWESHVADYDAGIVGSRRLMAWEVGLITADPGALRAKAAAQPHDPSFRVFAERAPLASRSRSFPTASGLHRAALEALGLGWLPVVTAATTFGEGGPRIEFPTATRRASCAAPKAQPARAPAAGRAVAFVGDGPSDRYAAGYADVVFAKHALVQLCLDAGWPFERWTEFIELDAWLARTLATFAADPRSLPRPRPRPLFCGAEVWGPGRFDPLPPDAGGEAVPG